MKYLCFRKVFENHFRLRKPFRDLRYKTLIYSDIGVELEHILNWVIN